MQNILNAVLFDPAQMHGEMAITSTLTNSFHSLSPHTPALFTADARKLQLLML